ETPWTVRTPRRGTHFFYRSVPGLRNAVKAHRGWDVRAGGNGYVVGFGSVVDGREYELIGEATLDLPPFDPAWLPPIPAEPLSETLSSRVAELRTRQLSTDIRDLGAYIRTIPSIQGQRGSDACFRVACILRDAGLTAEEALAYMLEWNRRCAIPPWSVAELRKKVRDSFSKLERRVM
ncbi:MAG: bifunctional DNA primase/polymerase, partial [Planctomycetes bacterium]|nr:bifunctional DNA primase/polymerase [Planctomycetota bacterium]